MSLPERASAFVEELGKIDPLKEPDRLREAVWRYLKPGRGAAPRAHLFTVNGLTYPIHRDYSFLAVPNPHELRWLKKSRRWSVNTMQSKRRYSLLAYLHSVRPGDLIFFFQADPQYPDDIYNRRGFRGIWIALPPPFLDFTSIKRPDYPEYEILGACPECGSPFDLGGGFTVGKCPICGHDFGTLPFRLRQGTRYYSKVILSARMLMHPALVFKKTAGDNRVYTDMTVEPLIWVSRADNAMGPGKGSSVRTLLPEEAAKIAYMLATEDRQSIEEFEPQKYPGETGKPITDHNGVSVAHPRVVREGGIYKVEHEFHLNMFFSLKFEDIAKGLDIPLNEVDYWTTEFPWGYTADTADFVASLWDDERGRHTIYLFEFKKDIIGRDALVGTLLYVPWVVLIMTQFRHETEDITVYPVLVGRSTLLSSLPSEYTFEIKPFVSPRPKKVHVKTPLVVEYEPVDVFYVDDKRTRRRVFYAKDLELSLQDLPTKAFTPPPITYTTTGVEREFVAQQYFSGF